MQAMTATQTVRAALAGMRVVSLAVYVPVPVAAQRLTALGAAVTSVEPPTGDPLALWSPDWYAELHAGQRVCRLDLKDPSGRAAFDAALAGADLLLTGVRLSALRRLGLDWGRMHVTYPNLSHVALISWESPDDDRPGHDLTVCATVGLVSPPALPITLLADLAAGERVLSTSLSLLLDRARGNGAGFAQVSLQESASLFAEPLRHELTPSGAVLGGGLPRYGLYRTRDGWIAVTALEPHFWSALVGALALDANADRAALQAVFETDTTEHWERWAGALGLPLAALRSPRRISRLPRG